MTLVAPRPGKAQPNTSRSIDGSHRRTAAAWTLFSWLGGAFAVLGLADIALGWYPSAFGNPEWEFGTISGSLNALTIPVMGFYLLVASAIARGHRRAGRILGVLLLFLAVVLLVLGFVYVTVIPLALRAVQPNDVVSLGMKKAIIKGLLLGIGYIALLSYGARQAWRAGAVAVE